MKRSKERNTITYKYNDTYFIDIVTTSEVIEAWIYNKDYGVKSLMFGLPIYQQTYSEALEIIEANAEDYISFYIEEYED